MKIKALPVYLLLITTLIPVSKLMPWGDKGHRFITAKAFECLPAEMQQFKENKGYIIEHCTDPDHRKRSTENEPQKHFIDVDYYKEFLNGRMVMDQDSLVVIYGDSTVKKEGILPWATEETLSKLTEAFRSKDKEKTLLYASDLAHYVADGFQPQHATVNYNGQLTGQKGVHSRYESKMFEKYESDLSNNTITDQGYYISNTPVYIFSYISASNYYGDVILNADKYAAQKCSGDFNDEYYRLLWTRTQYLTEEQVSDAARAIASMYYTAWVNAGRPELK